MGKHVITNPAKSMSMCLRAVMLLSIVLTTGGWAQEKPRAAAKRDSLIAAAREMMGLQTYCALVTLDSTGRPQARTMNPFPPDSNMTVWMATNSRSRKIREIRRDPRVCLYYADHRQASGYVAINGKAVLVDDMNEKLKRKRAYWDQAFPDWRTLILIKIVPERIEVIHYKRGFTNDPVTFRAPFIEMGGR